MVLAFQWPTPSTARVVEATEETNKASSEVAYRINVKRVEEHIEVTYSDMEVLSYDGQPAPPEVAAQVMQMGAMMPGFRVNPQGHFIDVTDLEPIIEATLATMKDEKSEEEFERMAAAFRNPRAVAMMTQGVAEIWNAWAGHFAGAELAVGRPARGEDKTGQVTLSLLAVEDNVATVEMVYNFASGPLLEQTKMLMRPMYQRMGKSLEELDKAFEGATAEKTLRVTSKLRLDTLQPLEVESQKDTLVRVPGAPESAQREVNRYTFTWDPPAQEG